MRFWRATVVVCLIISAGVCGVALGQLGGTFETVFVLDPTASGAPFISEATHACLGVEYVLANTAFELDSRLTTQGLQRVAFSGSTQLGQVALDSSLTFYPIGDEKSLLKTTIAPTHRYDLWSVYYVDSLRIENVNSSTDWQVQVSLDGTNWTVISPVLDASTHSTGDITLGSAVRYVEVVSVSGLLDSSYVSPELLTLIYSNSVWRSDLSVAGSEVSLYSTFILPVAGSPKLITSLSGPILDTAWLSASVELVSDPGECDLSFSSASAQISVPTTCIGTVVIDTSISCLGFGALTISVGDLLGDLSGLEWLTAGGVLEYELDQKTLTITPALNLEPGPCITLYGELVAGANPTDIQGISIYGLECVMTWNGLSLTSLSYLDDARLVSNKGSARCWEVLRLATEDQGCCGPIAFDCAVFFSKSSSSLFDVAEFDFELNAGLSDNLSFGIALVVEETGLSDMMFSFIYDW